MRGLHKGAPEKPAVMGYVYVLQSEKGHRKIGCTKYPLRRTGRLEIQLPFKVRIEFLLMCKLGWERDVERILHEKFRKKRLNGEWFDLDDSELDWFCQNPIPISIPTSHAFCYCQSCLALERDEDFLLKELNGVS